MTNHPVNKRFVKPVMAAALAISFACVSFLMIAPATAETNCKEAVKPKGDLSVPEEAYIVTEEKSSHAKIMVDLQSLSDSFALKDPAQPENACAVFKGFEDRFSSDVAPALSADTIAADFDLVLVTSRDEYDQPSATKSIGSAAAVKSGSAWAFTDIRIGDKK